MQEPQFFSVGTFARLARTTRDTLHHYDSIGLLSPMLRGENHYRYYSAGQLASINVVRVSRELGLTLEEIKGEKDKRNPEYADAFLGRRIDEIDKKMEDWAVARKLLTTLQKAIRSVRGVDEDAVTIQYVPAEAIIMGDINDYSQGQGPYDALLQFYNNMGERYPHLDLNFPVWGLFSRRRIEQGDWAVPERYYFYNPDGWDRRPAAQYAVGYTRGGYGHNDELYQRIVRYIDEQDYEICGDAYEEYPLNEFSISDANNYLLRVMIPVRQKAAGEAAAE